MSNKSNKPAKAVAASAGETTEEVKDKKPTLPTETFKADGKEFKFVVARFNVPGHGVITAEEALENDEVLAYLVKEKSSVIEKVK